jgi:hypothetical protein
MRLRLSEPSGTVRFTAGVATAQFAMRDMIVGFIAKYPKVNLVEHATDLHVVFALKELKQIDNLVCVILIEIGN